MPQQNEKGIKLTWLKSILFKWDSPAQSAPSLLLGCKIFPFCFHTRTQCKGTKARWNYMQRQEEHECMPQCEQLRPGRRHHRTHGVLCCWGCFHTCTVLCVSSQWMPAPQPYSIMLIIEKKRQFGLTASWHCWRFHRVFNNLVLQSIIGGRPAACRGLKSVFHC